MHKITTGSLPTSTGSTGTQQALSGQAERIYIRVDDVTYMRFADNTDSTGTSTNMGLPLTTGIFHEFKVGNPPPKYIYWVPGSTGALPFTIIEIN